MDLAAAFPKENGISKDWRDAGMNAESNFRDARYRSTDTAMPASTTPAQQSLYSVPFS